MGFAQSIRDNEAAFAAKKTQANGVQPFRVTSPFFGVADVTMQDARRAPKDTEPYVVNAMKEDTKCHLMYGQRKACFSWGMNCWLRCGVRTTHSPNYAAVSLHTRSRARYIRSSTSTAYII